MAINQDDHEKYLELVDQFEEATRQYFRILREHISSGPRPTSPAPVTSENFRERDRRLREAKSEMERLEEELKKFFPDLP